MDWNVHMRRGRRPYSWMICDLSLVWRLLSPRGPRRSPYTERCIPPRGKSPGRQGGKQRLPTRNTPSRSLGRIAIQVTSDRQIRVRMTGRQMAGIEQRSGMTIGPRVQATDCCWRTPEILDYWQHWITGWMREWVKSEWVNDPSFLSLRRSGSGPLGILASVLPYRTVIIPMRPPHWDLQVQLLGDAAIYIRCPGGKIQPPRWSS